MDFDLASLVIGIVIGLLVGTALGRVDIRRGKK